MDIINEKTVDMTFDEFCRGGKSLANELDAVTENGADPDLIKEAASELRRLQAENERLHQINQSHEMKLSVRGYEIQIKDLKAVNAELLDALKDMHGGWQYIRETHGDLYRVGWDRAQKKAEAAIAKEEGRL
jgi:hypothetical protein